MLNLAKNEFGSFEATIPYQINTAFGSYKNPVYTTLKYEKTWLVVEEDGKPIWLGYVTETEKLFDLSYKLYAEGVLGYLQRFVPKVNGGTYYLTTDNPLEQWSSVPSNSIFYLATQALKDYYQGPYGTFGIGKVNIQPGRTIDTSSKGTLFESQWSLLNTFCWKNTTDTCGHGSCGQTTALRYGGYTSTTLWIRMPPRHRPLNMA